MVRLPPAARPLFPYLKAAWVRGTALVAPVSIRLSARSDGWIPAGATTLAQADGRYAPARPAQTLERPPGPLGRPAGLPPSDPGAGTAVPAVGAAELPQGRILGPHRAVVDRRGRLVDDVSRYFGTTRPRQHPLYLNPRPPAPLEVAGRLGVLAARGDVNYYHFLLDVVTRLGVLEQAGIEPPARWYAPQSLGFQRDLLALAGIGAERVVDADAHPHVRAEQLVVAAPPAMTELNPPWAVQWLRDRLLPAVPAGPETPRRVFVTRGPSANNRSIRNEPAVRALLTERGYAPVDPGALSVAEQLRIFAGADRIVAAHGAALANLVFASAGAAVVELFPAGALLPDYWRLACGVPGLTYRYLSAPGPARTRQQAIVSDLDVDVDALASLLDELG